jgi:hypothetical protein
MSPESIPATSRTAWSVSRSTSTGHLGRMQHYVSVSWICSRLFNSFGPLTGLPLRSCDHATGITLAYDAMVMTTSHAQLAIAA